MITPYLKKSMATAIFNSQDLGGKSIEHAIQHCVDGEEYDSSDHLTAFLVSSINNAEELENIEQDIDYAIDMLQRAKDRMINTPII